MKRLVGFPQNGTAVARSLGTWVRTTLSSVSAKSRGTLVRPEQPISPAPFVAEALAQTRTVLSFQSVSFYLSNRRLLHDISFDLRSGERILVIGPRLSGKSLLLSLAAGHFDPSDGHVERHGAGGWPGVALDSVTLLDDETLRRNLRYFGGLCGMFGRRLRSRIDELAEQMMLTDVLDVPVSSLGAIDLRRADLARALVHAPSLLLLDELSQPPDTLEMQALLMDFYASPAAADLAILRMAQQQDGVLDDRTYLLREGRLELARNDAVLCEPPDRLPGGQPKSYPIT